MTKETKQRRQLANGTASCRNARVFVTKNQKFSKFHNEICVHINFSCHCNNFLCFLLLYFRIIIPFYTFLSFLKYGTA